jgi:hypothetical protein
MLGMLRYIYQSCYLQSVQQHFLLVSKRLLQGKIIYILYLLDLLYQHIKVMVGTHRSCILLDYIHFSGCLWSLDPMFNTFHFLTQNNDLFSIYDNE